MLKNYLEREAYSVGVAANGEAGVPEALSGRYAIAEVSLRFNRRLRRGLAHRLDGVHVDADFVDEIAAMICSQQQDHAADNTD